MLSGKVPYYILDLLQITPSVYVEGLGRFEAIFHAASVDLPDNKIKPPYIEPGFSDEATAYNDYLARYIRFVSGVDTTVASDAILAFADQVRDRTSEGGMWTIEKFGTFSRSSFGNIRFTPDWDAFNLSFSGLETLDIKPKTVYHQAPVYVPPSIPDIEHITSGYRPAEEVTNTTHVEEEVTAVFDSAGTVIEAEKQEQPGNSVHETTNRLWWTILLSAIILIAILCAYLAWDIISNRHKLDDLKQIRDGIVTTAPTDTAVEIEDSATIDVTNIPVQEIPTPAVEPVQQVEPGVPSGQACYVVVGAFGEQANVTKMMDRLTSMGYTAEELNGGGLNKVAIRTSCDPAVLQKTLNDARASINPEAWIY